MYSEDKEVERIFWDMTKASTRTAYAKILGKIAQAAGSEKKLKVGYVKASHVKSHTNRWLQITTACEETGFVCTGEIEREFKRGLVSSIGVRYTIFINRDNLGNSSYFKIASIDLDIYAGFSPDIEPISQGHRINIHRSIGGEYEVISGIVPNVLEGVPKREEFKILEGKGNLCHDASIDYAKTYVQVGKLITAIAREQIDTVLNLTRNLLVKR